MQRENLPGRPTRTKALNKPLEFPLIAGVRSADNALFLDPLTELQELHEVAAKNRLLFGISQR